MHYYQFNIGEYRQDAGHLSLVEHGIYRHLIDSYFLDEGPIPCREKLVRLLCVRSADEENALDYVLSEFFNLLDSGEYSHDGCDKRLREIFSKSEKARLAAKSRWKKHQEKQDDDAIALQTHSECSADGMPPTTDNLLPTTDIKISPNGDCQDSPDKNGRPPNCPHMEIIDLYHEILPSCTRVSHKLWAGSARAKMMAVRWREDADRQSLDWWGRFFRYVSTSDFLMGRIPQRDDKPVWMADIGWMLKPSNMIKILEGNYDNKHR